MSSAGLGISLAYLALDRFRYRRDVEEIVLKLHEKYENDSALTEQNGLEPVNELKWLCRKECNGHNPRGVYAAPYSLLYRRHADLLIVGALAALCAIIVFFWHRWPVWYNRANQRPLHCIN